MNALQANEQRLSTDVQRLERTKQKLQTQIQRAMQAADASFFTQAEAGGNRQNHEEPLHALLISLDEVR